MQDKKQEKVYFDEFTAEKPWNAFTGKTYRSIVSLFVKLARPEKNSKIIDMGCGTGELTEEIYRLGYRNVSGYDISGNCIALAKSRFKGINFEAKDIERTGLAPNSVDVLFYCGILHHFPVQKNAIREARRILKKGGRIFIFEPNASNPVLWLFRDRKSPVKSAKLKTPNEEFLTVAQIRGSFEGEGFRIERLDAVSSVHYTTDHFRKLLPFPFYHAVHLYNVFDDILNMTPLRKNGNGSSFR